MRIPFYAILPLSLAPLLCIVAGASVNWVSLFSSSSFLCKKHFTHSLEGEIEDKERTDEEWTEKDTTEEDRRRRG